MSLPLLSVIVPTYNRAHFLPETIENIEKQKYPNLKIIVIDDSSTDNTKEVVQNLGENIKYIYQENKGPAAARNTGLREARGEIIGFLDSDDLWPDNKLKLQLSTLLKSSTTEIIMGGVKHLMLSNSDKNEFIEYSELFNRNPFGCGLFKVSAFKKVGILNEELIQWEDLDWFLRATELRVEIIRQKEIVLLLRIHKGNISRDIISSKKYPARVLKASTERRRKLNNLSVNNLSLWSWT